MYRITEVILGSLVAAVFTRNFLIAAAIGFVLLLAWENMDYGVLGRKRDDHDQPTTEDDEVDTSPDAFVDIDTESEDTDE